MSFAYIAIAGLAILPIYSGSHAALRRPATAPRPTEEEEKDEDELTIESLGSSDAMLFPIIGGVVLLSLYLVIKYVGKEWINAFFNFYFAVTGLLANARSCHKLLTPMKQTGKAKKPFVVPLSSLHGICIIFSTVLGIYYWYTKNWVASNLIGLSFAFNAIQLMAIDSFATGGILLMGLFLYDIYFVFGTNVMVTVAKGIDAPIKLVFPKRLLSEPFGPATMLGLGDIVLPGIYIALALRFDLSQYHKRYSRASYWKGWFRFEQPYFHAAMLSYIAGLATTIAVMHSFQSAQPALLYLSPACLLSTLFTAWRRSEGKDVWAYEEVSQAAKTKDEEGDKVEAVQKKDN